MHEISQFILELNKVSVPCQYLDYLIIGLTLMTTISKFFGYEFLNFYYVTFFGLFPFRLYKEVFERSPMSFGSVVLLFIQFCLIWKYINRVIPFFFSNYFGQIILSLSLVWMDKLFFLDDLFGKNSISRYSSYTFIILALIIYWLYLGRPSFFLMALLQTFAWFSNFIKHFLYIKETQLCVDESLGKALPKDSSDFKWGNLVDLISFVSINKHDRPISNSLGSWFAYLRYPNIAKRYFPVNSTTSWFASNAKTIVPVIGPSLSGTLLVGSIEKFRIKNIVNHELQKKKLDALYEEQIKSTQKEMEQIVIDANRYSSSYITTKHLLESKGVKVSESVTDNMPLNADVNNTDLEIKKLLLDLNFFRLEYISAVTFLKRSLLRKVTIKKVVECDVEIIKLNPIQIIFNPDNKTSYRGFGLGLHPETLCKKAEKNSGIKTLLKKELPTEGCPLLNIQKIEKLSDKMSPLLETMFKETQLEFQEETLLYLKKQRNTTLDLDGDKTNIFFGSKDLWGP